MAEINYTFYDNKDIYNDGSVEDKLLDAYKNSEKLNMNEDGVFYLTTDVRSNILNWYPFKKDDVVLEIGCGCGTLTGMLCERCGTVYTVEGSKRRSKITYYRHQDKENLTVYAGNFDKFEIDKKFDYIILIGVFEYAKLFFDVDNPFDYFLEKIKKLLKTNGKVLLAIENRYGIKYWAGCNEDHLYKPYVGLESYDGTNIQTFGKQEFIDLITKHDFLNYKFYYPFPDYKLPSIIYTDNRLPKKDEINNLPIYLYDGKENFDIHKVLDGLLDNKLFDVFSNSFLVEFGLKDATVSDISYARNLSYRDTNYKTITLETEKHEIVKLADNEKAKIHLDNIVNIHNKLKKNNIRVCNAYQKEEKYYMEYIEGKNFSEYILELTKNEDWDLIEKEIDKLIDYYKSISILKKITNPASSSFLRIYNGKTHVMKVSIIDGNASNIIIDKNGNYVFIDQEWETNKELPTEYLIYFSIVHIFTTNEKLSNKFKMVDILKKYDISPKKIKVFNEYDNYYFRCEHNIIDDFKSNNLSACLGGSKDNYQVNYTVLYYDIGNDFNEENKIINTYKKLDDDIYSIDFTLPKNVKRIRFDPQIIGNKFVYFEDILINDKKIEYEEYNIFKFKNKDTLIECYPFIVFPWTRTKINIKIKFKDFTIEDEKEFLENNRNNLLLKDEQINNLIKQNNLLNDELNNIKNTRIINRIKNFINGKFKV